jgi:hypothetical protein
MKKIHMSRKQLVAEAIEHDETPDSRERLDGDRGTFASRG